MEQHQTMLNYNNELALSNISDCTKNSEEEEHKPKRRVTVVSADGEEQQGESFFFETRAAVQLSSRGLREVEDDMSHRR